MGLSFKPNTDDLRDAASLTLIKTLNRLGAKVKAYDPALSHFNKDLGLPGVDVESNVESLARGCNALVLVTEWDEFLDLDFLKLGQLMTEPTIVDGRNILNKERLQEHGFTYIGIGH